MWGMWVLRLGAGLIAALTLPVAWGAPARAKSLAQFDSGYAQCEKRHADMRGHRDQVYAGVYRLRLDDALRKEFSEARSSAVYKAEHRRASQAVARNAAASDVADRLALQCLALKREIKATPAGDAKR